MTKESPAPNKPVKVFRLKGVSASVFENVVAGNKSPFYKVSVQRTYKQGDELKATTNLSRDDLPIAANLMVRAWEFILETESTHRAD